jgi:hypothetical protein
MTSRTDTESAFQLLLKELKFIPEGPISPEGSMKILILLAKCWEAFAGTNETFTSIGRSGAPKSHA